MKLLRFQWKGSSNRDDFSLGLQSRRCIHLYFESWISHWFMNLRFQFIHMICSWISHGLLHWFMNLRFQWKGSSNRASSSKEKSSPKNGRDSQKSRAQRVLHKKSWVVCYRASSCKVTTLMCVVKSMCVVNSCSTVAMKEKNIWFRLQRRGGGLGSSTIFKDLMSPTPRRKWYLTTGRRAH